MIPHIIHNPANTERRQLLMKEIQEQQIPHVQWWAAVMKENGTHGCHLSHREIVYTAQGLGYPAVLIWEDDVKFTDKGAFSYFIQNIPDVFDIYTAGTYGQGAEYDERDGTIKWLSGTHCYIVHSRFYDRYLQMDEFNYTDTEISRHAGIIKMCMPMTALQHAGMSEILKQHVDYNNPKWVAYPLWKNTQLHKS